MSEAPQPPDHCPLLCVEETAACLEELAASAQAEGKTVALHLRDAAHHLRHLRQSGWRAAVIRAVALAEAPVVIGNLMDNAAPLRPQTQGEIVQGLRELLDDAEGAGHGE